MHMVSDYYEGVGDCVRIEGTGRDIPVEAFQVEHHSSDEWTAWVKDFGPGVCQRCIDEGAQEGHLFCGTIQPLAYEARRAGLIDASYRDGAWEWVIWSYANFK